MSVSQRVRREAVEKSDGRCAFPGCPPLYLRDGRPVLEVATITALHVGGPRYEASETEDDRYSIENLIVVCPSHHALIDRDPERYSVARLRELRKWSFSESEVVNRPQVVIPKKTLATLEEIVAFWERERGNPVEEVWQEFFMDNPIALALALEGRAYTLQSKCYVGGKGISNVGGNIVDFIARYYNNCALLEIKTPMTSLMGGKYRDNAFSPSRHLVGACVQTLEYKDSLARHIHSLAANDASLNVFDPRMVVIIGDSEQEKLTYGQVRSFELFRNAFSGIRVYTFNELFDGVRQWLE